MLSTAVIMAAFLLAVGLGPGRLPFPPESRFSDAVISHWPNALFLRRAVLEDHAWPLWRPLIMSGQPFAANPLNKVWYPPQWLVLVFPPTLHLNLLIWLHLSLAGIGAWTWSRTTGLKPWPAALAGLGYACAPRLIAALGAGHLDILYAAAWLPWLLWAAHRTVYAAPVRHRELGLAVIAALCFLADVRISAYAFVTAAVYTAWLVWQMPERRDVASLRRLGLRLIAAILLAAGLTAVQWVPLLLLRSDLTRGTITLHEAAAESLKPGQWIGLLIGDHGGAWETMVYVGISTLVLAITALLLRPRQLGFWGLLVVVIALYAMGDHFVLWTVLNRLIPPLRWWRVPPRVWLIAALILPYLAGWGAQLVTEHPTNQRGVRLGVVALFGGGMVCGLFSTATLSTMLEWTATVGIFALPATALIMALAVFGRLRPRLLLAGFTVIVAADGLWIDRTLVEGRDETVWLDPYRELAEFLIQDGATRVYSPSYSLPQQAGAYWRIPQFDGVDPFQLARYAKSAELATGVAAHGYSITLPAYQADGTDLTAEELLATANREAPINPALLAEWDVSHVVSAFEIKAAGLELAAQIGDVYVYRNVFAPPVEVRWQGPNRVTIRAAGSSPGPLYAVTNGRWKSADHALPGLPGVAGSTGQSWTYQYDPSEIWISLLVALILIPLALWMSL